MYKWKPLVQCHTLSLNPRGWVVDSLQTCSRFIFPQELRLQGKLQEWNFYISAVQTMENGVVSRSNAFQYTRTCRFVPFWVDIHTNGREMISRNNKITIIIIIKDRTQTVCIQPWKEKCYLFFCFCCTEERLAYYELDSSDTYIMWGCRRSVRDPWSVSSAAKIARSVGRGKRRRRNAWWQSRP